MAQILVPIFVCVVLPVAIIAIIFGASINSDNKRSKVLIKAIESNCDIDADKLAEALQKPKKTALEILNLRLLRGCIFSLVGIAVLHYRYYSLQYGHGIPDRRGYRSIDIRWHFARNRSKLPCGLLRDPQTNQRVNMI